MSFKNKIIFTNATILILFVISLTYSAIEIVHLTSQSQFNNITESIIDNNKKLLFTFLNAQSKSLDKEIEFITEEVVHLTTKFDNGIIRKSKSESVRDKQLMYINSDLKSFIKSVRFIDTESREEISITKGGIVSKSIFIDVNSMIQYKNLFIYKETNGDSVTKFSIYIKPEHWKKTLLKFELNLEHLSQSLIFENIIDEFHYRYFLVDDNGNIIVSNLQKNVGQLMTEIVYDKRTQKNVESQIMSSDLGGFIVKGFKGVFNVTFVKNHQTGWRLILVTPEHVIRSRFSTTKDLLLSGDNSLIKSLFSAYAVLLALFLIINSVSVNKMLVPISKLTDQVKLLKKGNFNDLANIVQSDGDEIELLSKAYCEAGNKIQGLIEGLEREVEERTKQYEVAAKEASEANRQKSILLSNVSHEIRTPLNAIVGYTHMLTHSQKFNSHKHELNGITSASHTILSIVNDLLDFERVKSSGYSLKPKCISVADLINDIEKTFILISESKKLSLDVICNVEASGTLFIDELRIKQAINNIVSNALKFTTKGGVTIEVSADSQNFNISIIDTGVGIPKEKLDSIFNGFEQVNQEDQQFGFGLGLAITKTIVELMNGTLHVESELGIGSKFIISLPVIEVMDVLECSNHVAEQGYNVRDMLYTAGGRALIVDDVEFNREILEFHLKEAGFECMVAKDGLEALSLVSENEFDVVLTDISMPIMDGVELASELRKRKPTLPIIAVTARATVQEESRMNQYFSCYLTKPINPADLKAKLYCALVSGTCHLT